MVKQNREVQEEGEVRFKSEKGLRIALLVVGLGVLLLLIFADKTNLSNKPSITTPTSPAGNAGSAFAEGLPPLAPQSETDRLLEAYANAKDQEKIRILDSIIINLQARKRYGYAAEYADLGLAGDSSLSNLLRAGQLNVSATELTYISQDSALFKKYSDRGIRYLNEVLAKDPENQQARLDLGKAYINSRVLQNTMLGVQQLRRVLEINPENVEASYQLGLLSVQSGQLDRAVERFERVLELAPDHTEAQFRLASVYVQLERAAEAIPLLENLVDNREAGPQLQESAQQLLNAVR